MQDEKSKTQQGSRSKRGESGPTKLYRVIALNCCTVDNKKTPYFFLFSDIDTKDKFQLSRVLKFFTFNELSFYYYETSKGYHVISPCLLSMEEWYKLRRGLKLVENGYYEGLNIRFSPKNKNDFKNGRYQPIESKFNESLRLNELMVKRCKFKKNPPIRAFNQMDTKLFFNVYQEIEIEGVQY